MSIKEIKEGIEKGKVIFGAKQAIKFFKNKKTKKEAKVFVAKDARESTKKILSDNSIEFSLIKGKTDIVKELDLNFESEVFLIK